MPRRGTDSDSDCNKSRKKKKSRRHRSSSSSSSTSSSSTSSSPSSVTSSSSSTTSSSSSSSVSLRRERHKKKSHHRAHSSSSSHSREREHFHKRRSPSHITSRHSSPRHKSERPHPSSYSKFLSKQSRSGSKSGKPWGSRPGSHSSRVSGRKSRSPKRSKNPYSQSVRGSKLSEEETLKAKLQQALKAAATADAELREKGLLTECKVETKHPTSNSLTPTFADQLKRAQAIEEINAPVFSQQEFLASRQSSKSDSQKSSVSASDAHNIAIFELSTDKLLPSADTVGIAPIKCLTNWKEKPELLAHENLFEDFGVKMERWKKKLGALRRRKVNGELQMYM